MIKTPTLLVALSLFLVSSIQLSKTYASQQSKAASNICICLAPIDSLPFNKAIVSGSIKKDSITTLSNEVPNNRADGNAKKDSLPAGHVEVSGKTISESPATKLKQVTELKGSLFDSLSSINSLQATVSIKGRSIRTGTDEKGFFILKDPGKLPLTLIITALGYKTSQYQVTAANFYNLHIALESQSIITNQVVVSASRVAESILTSPVTIEKLSIKNIRESPAANFYDAIEGVKGVQMITLGLGYKVPNTRGFAGTTNSRFLQMVDGVDVISPGIGAPIANLIGPTELDIESVELIPGAASALYGLNAVNGISNLKTKSAFKYQGISVYEKIGVNHINDKDHSPTPYNEVAIRYAQAIGTRFAFKLNGSFSKGTDWIANNQQDQYFLAGNKTNAGLAINPAADLINKYGDEYNSDMKTISLGGKKYDVSRTGYFEKDLTDYSIHNFKADAALEYKLNKSTEIIYTYRLGNGSTLYQRGNRVRLDGEQIQQHVLDIKGQDYELKAYEESENTGTNSYNMRALAENLDLASKKPTQWYADYTKGFNTAIKNGSTLTDAFTQARAAADLNRLQPGTAAFKQAMNQIIHINNWDTVGAQYLLHSKFVHVDGQYDWSRLIKSVKILTGFNYRTYIVSPDGDNYVNPLSFNDPSKATADFTYTNYGGFISASKTLFDEKLKINASFRVDKSQYYSVKFNPRVAITFSPSSQDNFRISFQNGYRFPTLFEGYAYVNNGGVKRLGGFEVISRHLGVFENSYINASVTSFKNSVNKLINAGQTQDQAIQQSKNLLVKSNYSYLQPEHINSFEIGYKGLWLNNKVFVDIDYYFSAYDHFIGQLDVTQPARGQIGTTDSTAYAAYNGGKQIHKYKMWTNSTSLVTNQGIEAGISWEFYKKFNIRANASYAKLISISAVDAFTPAFNTPPLIVNLSVGNSELAKNLGFTATMHYQAPFFWSSPLAAGNVPGYRSIDAQLTYRMPKLNSSLKFGATDLANKRYIQYLGGPTLGAFYYASLLVDIQTRNH